LILDARSGLPGRGKIFVLKILVKMDALVVFVHVNAVEASGLAHDVPDGIVGARTRWKPVGYHPDSFESLRILDNLRRSIPVFFLHSFPRCGRLVYMAIGGDQLEIDHLLLLPGHRVSTQPGCITDPV
jgi:hypothetical protein